MGTSSSLSSSIWCDLCQERNDHLKRGDRSLVNLPHAYLEADGGVREVRRQAKAEGWAFTRELDLCPDCIPFHEWQDGSPIERLPEPTGFRNITPKVRFRVLTRDHFTCQYCGRSAPDVRLEIDHVEPVSRGGRNRLDNLKAACFECNRGKHDQEI